MKTIAFPLRPAIKPLVLRGGTWVRGGGRCTNHSVVCAFVLEMIPSIEPSWGFYWCLWSQSNWNKPFPASGKKSCWKQWSFLMQLLEPFSLSWNSFLHHQHQLGFPLQELDVYIPYMNYSPLSFTKLAPEKLPKPERRGMSSNHHLSGAFVVELQGRGPFCGFGKLFFLCSVKRAISKGE